VTIQGPIDVEAVGDVVDRDLAVERRQLFERLGHHGLESFRPAGAKRPQRAGGARRLEHMRRKRHRVAHLPRLGQRREQLHCGKIGPKVLFARVHFDELPGLIEAGFVGIDEVEHRGEGRVVDSLAAR
jgi:hypothetical protein